MGGLSIWHWLIVLVVVIAVFGTKKLRNVGSDLGAAVKGFKDGMKDGSADAPAPRAEVHVQTDGGDGRGARGSSRADGGSRARLDDAQRGALRRAIVVVEISPAQRLHHRLRRLVLLHFCAHLLHLL